MKKEKSKNYKEEFTLTGSERIRAGIFLAIIDTILIIGLIHYGFKNWMILAWVGKFTMIWLLISKTRYYGIETIEKKTTKK